MPQTYSIENQLEATKYANLAIFWKIRIKCKNWKDSHLCACRVRFACRYRPTGWLRIPAQQFLNTRTIIQSEKESYKLSHWMWWNIISPEQPFDAQRKKVLRSAWYFYLIICKQEVGTVTTQVTQRFLNIFQKGIRRMSTFDLGILQWKCPI